MVKDPFEALLAGGHAPPQINLCSAGSDPRRQFRPHPLGATLCHPVLKALDIKASVASGSALA